MRTWAAQRIPALRDVLLRPPLGAMRTALAPVSTRFVTCVATPSGGGEDPPGLALSALTHYAMLRPPLGAMRTGGDPTVGAALAALRPPLGAMRTWSPQHPPPPSCGSRDPLWGR